MCLLNIAVPSMRPAFAAIVGDWLPTETLNGGTLDFVMLWFALTMWTVGGIVAIIVVARDFAGGTVVLRPSGVEVKGRIESPSDPMAGPHGWAITSDGSSARVTRAWAPAFARWWQREWRVRHGELAVHTRFLFWERDRSFTRARLEVTSRRDRESATIHYTLEVIDGSRTGTIAWEVDDHAGIVALGRWLSERTGFPLTLPDDLQ